jgi:hypothetical protein
MRKSRWSTGPRLGAIIIISGICFLLLGYSFGREVDKVYCYHRLGTELGVPPTYSDLKLAIYSQISRSVYIGMNHREVTDTFSKIAPIAIIEHYTNLGGDYVEMIDLKTCMYLENDFLYLTTYSQDGTIKQITWLDQD